MSLTLNIEYNLELIYLKFKIKILKIKILKLIILCIILKLTIRIN